MGELMVACPECGQVHEDLTAAENEIRRLRRKVTRLENELSDQRQESPLIQKAHDVFDYWCAIGDKKQDTVFGPARQKAVLARLQEFEARQVDGVQRLKRAVDGLYRAGRWQLPNGQRSVDKRPGAIRRDDLELICRNEANVDRFCQLAEEPVKGSPSRLRVERLAWGFWQACGGGHVAGLDRWPEVCGDWVARTDEALRLARKGDGWRDRWDVPARDTLQALNVRDTAPLDLRNVLEAFHENDLRVVGRGAQFKAQCPFHDRHANGDRTPSVSVTEKPDGKTLLNCFGCGARHIELARALHLYDRDRSAGPLAGQIELREAA